MVKAYLSYQLEITFGSVSTNPLPAYSLIRWGQKTLVLVAADEYVHAFCPQTNEIQFTISPESNDTLAAVTAIEANQAGSKAAIGYSNGTILIFDLQTLTVERSIDTNSKAISVLAMVGSGLLELLVCGSLDNSVGVYDIGAGELLFPLKGHQSPVIAIAVVAGGRTLLTAAKDGILKAWDLSNGTLLTALATQKSELTGLALLNLQLTTGSVACVLLTSNDEEILLYKIDPETARPDGASREVLKRPNYRKIIQAQVSEDRLFLLDDNNELEIYSVLGKEEVGKKYKRKVKREVKDLPSEEEYKSRTINCFAFAGLTKLGMEVRRFTIANLKTKAGITHLFLGFGTRNEVGKWRLSFSKDQEASFLEPLASPKQLGHTQPINVVCLSSDDEFLLSASADVLILWHTKTARIAKRFDITNCSAIAFLPKDRFAVVGTKAGRLCLVDLLAGEEASSIELRSVGDSSAKEHKPVAVNDIRVQISPDTKVVEILTISSDRQLVIYRLASRGGAVQLRSTRSLRLNDEPLRLGVTPDQRHLIIAFIDNSLKLYHYDTLKEHLTLYGHSLPVVDFDISSDGYVLASISNDKTLRIWDRDFGNCRRIINRVHESGVHALRILPETHYALSAGKDGLVKFWDLDSFELIMLFEHLMGGAVRALAISSIGDFFITAGVNRALRRYNQTKEQVFAEETRERLQEEALVAEELRIADRALTKDILLKRFESLKSAEQLMDLIDEVELQSGDLQREYEGALLLGKRPPQPDFKTFEGQNPAEVVLERLDQINRNALDPVLVFLHFKHVKALVFYVAFAVENAIFEPLCLVLVRFFMERHWTNLAQSNELLRTLRRTSRGLIRNIERRHKVACFNFAALTLNINELKMLK